ncbi:hypothetical protein K1T71_006381 [Dendrolimus kikuchii]|uniref:Uncharacterized protein n=1 Tax=Dendrolimus kikuchii TaxID=765133 RepID=A0ACC1D4P4_9NEOP|nr:hypothetical protein K1T71_006381 [Dendrolimus kikuchii]
MYNTLLILFVIAAAFLPPSSQKAVQEKMLSAVLNETICPMEVKFDVQETRIPKTIKQILCAKPSHDVCDGDYAHVACCGKDDACKHILRCEQIEHTVLVGNINDDSLTPLSVPVGCSLYLQVRRSSPGVEASSRATARRPPRCRLISMTYIIRSFGLFTHQYCHSTKRHGKPTPD